ncbi:MAG: hypothetical protein ACQEXJ_18105 [Myxococcota bacterium]
MPYLLRTLLTASFLVSTAAFAACSSSDSTPAADAGPDVPTDVAGGTDAAADTGPDTVADADATTDGDGEGDTAQFPARGLPFEFTRPADGEPIPADEVTAFTEKVSGAWKDVGYFRWLIRTSTGVDASTDMEDYLAWYRGVTVVKSDGSVTFEHRGAEHNMWIPGSKVLAALIAGYRLTGDEEIALLTEQYCKGLSAVVKGFRRGEDDPAPYLMARAVFPIDHSFTLDTDRWGDDGREKNVLFTTFYEEQDRWNAKSFAWPDNPYWGDIWVTNMRSKDDVCAITRTTTWLYYVVEDAEDEEVREACAETLEIMQGFNKDIVDHGYNIRTKTADGTPRLVTEEDLGSYVSYTEFDPQAECPARLATDLIAYGEPYNDCGSGEGDLFDEVAPETHYYNYPIVWDYHMAALGNALAHGYDDVALELMGGLRDRIDRYMAPDTDEPGASRSDWDRDMAVLLIKAASMGLPLTAREARHVQAHYSQAAEDLSDFPRWDVWDDSVPDGEYDRRGGFQPEASDDGVEVESFALLLEACASPFLNPDGAAFVDCDVLRDTDRWGGEGR